MSKHPTSELSARDMACIEYGRRLEDLLGYYYPYRHHVKFESLCEVLDQCRAARNRIFRSCYECRHCDIECGFCDKTSPESRRLIWDDEYACACPHFTERGEP